MIRLHLGFVSQPLFLYAILYILDFVITWHSSAVFLITLALSTTYKTIFIDSSIICSKLF